MKVIIAELLKKNKVDLLRRVVEAGNRPLNLRNKNQVIQIIATAASKEDFWLALAEAVGANEKLDLKKYSKFIGSWNIKNYTVYRYWSDYERDFKKLLNGDIDQIKVSKQPYYNTTLSFNALQEMAADGGFMETGPITKHKGKGIDVIAELKEALPHLTKEVNFVKSVIGANQYQKEIFFLSPITTIKKRDIVSYYDADSDKFKKLS